MKNEIKKVNIRLFGRVVHGKGRGKSLGFPTANILLQNFEHEKGVYACLVNIKNEAEPCNKIRAITNIGTQPSLPSGKLFAEAFLFDFCDDIYEKELQIDCLYFIRPEIKFASIDELKKQISSDIALANELLSEA